MTPLKNDDNKLVMIVDDDPQIRLLLGEALLSAGLRVKKATSGEQALEMLASCRPDLILLDVIMRGMNGFEVCSRIIENPKTADIPIVMVTATNDLESVKRAYNMGVIDFISKPISWGVVGYRVNFLLRALTSFSDLKTSERRLIRAQSIAKVGNWEWVRETGKASFSNEAKRILRLSSPEESSFKSFINRVHDQDRQMFKDALKTALEHSGSFSIDHQIALPDGETFYVHTEAEVVRKSDGAPLLMEGTILDISERKIAEAEKLELERRFWQAQRLESLGMLAGGIAHDFNNILSAIIGHCFIAKTNPDQINNHIFQIENSAEHAAELCRMMITYAGKTKLSKSQVNISELVNEIINMLKSTIKQNVEIKTTIQPDIPYIEADASQIKQVVMNLLINAAEAIGWEQGEIHLSLAIKSFTPDQLAKDYFGKPIPDGDYLCLEITDNGCGMEDETIYRIFEPFYTTKSTGRGLGMSAVLGIISAHDSALQIFSKPGKGTTFKVYLPILDSHDVPVKSTQEAGSIPWRGNGEILLADDNDSVRLGASAMLQFLGFTVLQASNGMEALGLYQDNAADIVLVLSDLDMPLMNGYELLLKLRKINPALPIIISTGYEDTDLIDQNDSVVLLKKPFFVEQLREVLKSILDDSQKHERPNGG
jgi:CheY-like chemotaxis protein